MDNMTSFVMATLEKLGITFALHASISSNWPRRSVKWQWLAKIDVTAQSESSKFAKRWTGRKSNQAYTWSINQSSRHINPLPTTFLHFAGKIELSYALQKCSIGRRVSVRAASWCWSSITPFEDNNAHVFFIYKMCVCVVSCIKMWLRWATKPKNHFPTTW